MFDLFFDEKIDSGVQKLLELADYLENYVQDEEFDLEDFGHSYKKKELERRSCGTVLCACGHATKLWPRAFKVEATRDNPYEPYSLDITLKSNPGLQHINPFAKFFDISTTAAQYLFLDSSYLCGGTRKKVIARIRKFCVAKHFGLTIPESPDMSMSW